MKRHLTICDQCGKEKGSAQDRSLNMWLNVTKFRDRVEAAQEVDICSYNCLAAFGNRKQAESGDHTIASLSSNSVAREVEPSKQIDWGLNYGKRRLASDVPAAKD